MWFHAVLCVAQRVSFGTVQHRQHRTDCRKRSNVEAEQSRVAVGYNFCWCGIPCRCRGSLSRYAPALRPAPMQRWRGFHPWRSPILSPTGPLAPSAPLVSKMARGLGTGARSVRKASQTGKSATGAFTMLPFCAIGKTIYNSLLIGVEDLPQEPLQGRQPRRYADTLVVF
jgi:hypothetical protein